MHSLQKMLETNYSYGIERDEEQLRRNDADFRKWSNPLEVRYVFNIYWVVYEILLGYHMHRL